MERPEISAVIYGKIKALSKGVKSGLGGSTLGSVCYRPTNQKLIVAESGTFLRTGEFVPESEYPNLPEFVQRNYITKSTPITKPTENPFLMGWCYGNGILILYSLSGSQAGRCWVSTDLGVTLTRVELPPFIWNIQFGGGRFVGLASSGSPTFSITSTDGLNWTQHEQGRVLNGFSSRFEYHDGVWVAPPVTGNSNVWRSVDGGVSWNPVSNGTSGSDGVALLGFVDGEWILTSTIGYSATVSSTDGGLTWSPKWPGPQTIRTVSESPLARVGNVLLTGYTRSSTNYIYVSRGDVRKWTLIEGLPSYSLFGSPQSFIATERGEFLIVYQRGVAYSDDLGVSWSLLPRKFYEGWGTIVVDIVLNGVVRVLSFRSWPEVIDELVRAIGTDIAVLNHYMKIA